MFGSSVPEDAAAGARVLAVAGAETGPAGGPAAVATGAFGGVTGTEGPETELPGGIGVEGAAADPTYVED